ncbi:MAG: HEAT repeat domain-containing protein [Candidatus Omnitrophica bacterium]|nr:HEAT repeat domain-containing protein [Candidatus Omnitrophota bacterium]
MIIKPKIIIFTFFGVIAVCALIVFIDGQRVKNLDGNFILDKVKKRIEAKDSNGAFKQIKLALRNSDIQVRAKAIEMLELFSDPAELEVLTKAAQDENSLMRLSAARVLGKKHGQGIIKTLKALLLDSDKSVSQTAYQALLSMEQIPKGSLGFSFKNSSIFLNQYSRDALLDQGDSKAVPILLEMLEETNNEILTEAVEIISQKHVQDPRVVEPLINFMNNRSDSCLGSLINVSKSDETQRSRALIDNALDSKEWDLFSSVIKTVGRTQDAKALRSLNAILNDARWSSFDDEIKSLPVKEDGHRDIRPGLLKAYNQAESIKRIVRAALGSFGTADASKREETVETLLSLLAMSEQQHGAKYIIERLAQLKEIRAIGPIIDASCKVNDYATEMTALYATKEINKAETIKYLISMMSDQNNKNRVCAIKMLEKLGDHSCVDALIVSLKDKDSQVRAACAHALGILKATKSVDALIAALDDEAESVTDAVLAALGAIRYSRAVEPIVNAIQKRKVNALAGVTALYNITGKRWDYLLSSSVSSSSQESLSGEPSSQRPVRLKVNASSAR